MPAVESRIEGVNVDLIDASTLDASMLSQLDFGGPSQDSIDLMFQNMPYEVSEPVMCMSISPYQLHAKFDTFLRGPCGFHHFHCSFTPKML